MADNSSTSWIDDIFKKVMGLGASALDMAPLIFLANWAQGQAEKGSIDAKNALTQIKEMGTQWQTGMDKAQLPTATVDKMRGALENRAYTPPVTPLTGQGDVPVTNNAPAPFNPYKGTATAPATMGGGVSPDLLAMVKNIAQGNTQNQTNTNWGSNNLMNQLALRGGQRAPRTGNQSGQLTPLQLPQGNTNLYPNIRPAAKPALNQFGDVDATPVPTRPYTMPVGTGLPTGAAPKPNPLSELVKQGTMMGAPNGTTGNAALDALLRARGLL